jgi:hypothetical protein
VVTRLVGGSLIVGLWLGGFLGAVYLAREETLYRLVAIKVIPPDAAEHAGSRERFRREARTAARLAHPNIVPLHAFGEVAGTMYFVMGYVRGESLGERLRREGKLKVEEARKILADVAAALDHAHRQGVVHRDVKPDNVLLEDESGRALLTDFGVAKAAAGGATLTEVGSIVGTPHFMSPEQVSGQATLDGRSDLYSLGVVAYSVITGRLPFEGPSARDVLLQHLGKEPPVLKELEPSVPDDVASALQRCLAKNPSARWPDAGRLRDVLAPGGGEEEELPAALASLEGVGVWLLPWAIVLLYGVWLAQLWRLSWAASAPLRFLLAIVALLPVRYVGRVITARTMGFGWGAIARAVFRQPSFWPTVYPRPLRREGDVWDRLPAMTKGLRTLLVVVVGIAVTEGLLVFALLGIPPQELGPTGLQLARTVTWLTHIVTLGLPVGLVLGLAWYNLGKSWALRRGLEAMDGYRLLVEPTARSAFWKRPHIAGLLAPAGFRATPRSPRDYLEAIERAVGGVEGEVASSARDLARDLSKRLLDLDRDIAGLGRDADPAEARRLSERLAALGPESPTEAGERRQMRQLLQKQSDLMGSLAARLATAEALRARLLQVLGRLWEETTRLAERRGPTSGSIGARLRTLCAELAQQAGRAGDAPGSDACDARAAVEDQPTREHGLHGEATPSAKE